MNLVLIASCIGDLAIQGSHLSSDERHCPANLQDYGLDSDRSAFLNPSAFESNCLHRARNKPIGTAFRYDVELHHTLAECPYNRFGVAKGCKARI